MKNQTHILATLIAWFVTVSMVFFISKDSAAESALAYAQKLAAMPMHAVLATKRLTVAAIDKESTSLDNLAIKAFADCLAFDEAQATLRKFGMVG